RAAPSSKGCCRGLELRHPSGTASARSRVITVVCIGGLWLNSPPRAANAAQARSAPRQFCPTVEPKVGDMGPRKGAGWWRRAALALAVLLLGAGRSLGDSLPPPTGAVVLTVTGRISHTTTDSRAEFDRAALEALGMHRARTSTAWTDGVSIFEGPLL